MSLASIYAELEAITAGASCPRSTRCCRFVETGREPYLGRAEAEAVIAAVARRGGRLPRGGGPQNCPLLKADGGCAIYADRPFGCRTFFCDDATVPSPPTRRELERLNAALRQASEPSGDPTIAPLSTWLEGASRTDGRLRVLR